MVVRVRLAEPEDLAVRREWRCLLICVHSVYLISRLNEAHRRKRVSAPRTMPISSSASGSRRQRRIRPRARVGADRKVESLSLVVLTERAWPLSWVVVEQGGQEMRARRRADEPGPLVLSHRARLRLTAASLAVRSPPRPAIRPSQSRQPATPPSPRAAPRPTRLMASRPPASRGASARPDGSPAFSVEVPVRPLCRRAFPAEDAPLTSSPSRNSRPTSSTPRSSPSRRPCARTSAGHPPPTPPTRT